MQSALQPGGRLPKEPGLLYALVKHRAPEGRTPGQ